MLHTIFQQKPEFLGRMADQWHQITGAQLLVIDQAGDVVANSNGTVSESYREWLAQVNLKEQTQTTFEGQPVQVLPLNVQGVPAGCLVAMGESPPELLDWIAEALEALMNSEQALKGMTDELISAWDQLELVYRVTQSLASTADIMSVLRSVLVEVKRVLSAKEGFLILEQEDKLTHVSDDSQSSLSPQRRQLYYHLQRAGQLVICNDAEAVREFWPDAPGDLTNLLGIRLPATAPDQSVVALMNKGGRGFTAGDGKLLSAIAEQIAAIINNTLLHQQVLAQERMKRELEIAAEIQTSLLPHGLPQVPQVEFGVASLPATEVGGDFYDFISLDDNLLGIVIGDVAGKGVPAALLTSLSRTILRVDAAYGHSPQQVITQTNQALMQDLQHAEMFVTAMVAYLDWEEMSLTYANAGHTPGLWWRADQAKFEPLTATTPPLGIQFAEPWSAKKLQLSPGDFVVFYTDGVTEAMSPGNQVFGGERLKEALAAHSGGSAEDLIQSVLAAIRTFRRDAPRSDDLTLIAMRAKSLAVPDRAEKQPVVEFAFPADLEFLESISEKITATCRSLPGLPPSPDCNDFIYLVELAASEICTNIIQHSYLLVGGEIRGRLTPLDNGIQIDLYDDGDSFDPDSVPEPATQLGSLNEGGYGLHIVRQIMDKVTYRANTPDGNHWHLVKHITGKKPESNK